MNPRYDAEALRVFGTALLEKAGLPAERARTVADVLLEGDLFGHTTHGMQLLVPYLKSIEAGKLTLRGEVEVVKDTGPAMTWDGNYLPGPWLVRQAIKVAVSRIEQQGVVTAVIRRSHHIGCLQAYLKPVTDRGLMIVLTCSDPSTASVAPHGGLTALYTPNPLAAGIPTSGAPILMDISMSTTSNGLTMRLNKKGERLPGEWVKDAQGNATDDPGALFSDPPGTILPLGGMDLGYKGFALGLLVEALTSGLGGFGRSGGPDQWGASVYFQILDPSVFGGREAFVRETQHLADQCHSTPVKAGDAPVRLPGEAGLRRREEQLSKGVLLHAGIMESLTDWAVKHSVAVPKGQSV